MIKTLKTIYCYKKFKEVKFGYLSKFGKIYFISDYEWKRFWVCLSYFKRNCHNNLFKFYVYIRTTLFKPENASICTLLYLYLRSRWHRPIFWYNECLRNSYDHRYYPLQWMDITERWVIDRAAPFGIRQFKAQQKEINRRFIKC